MLRSEHDNTRYFIGYGFLRFLPYDEYVDDLLYWEYEDIVDGYVIVSSMGGFRYTTSEEIE